MAEDVTTLDSIFRMITPADLLGAQKLSLGKKVPLSILRELLDIVFSLDGAQNVDKMSESLDALQKKVTDPAAADQFKRIIHFYKTGQPCAAFGDAPFMALDSDGKSPINKVTFDQIVGKNVKLSPKKSMGIMLCNSGFLSPSVRNAERVELFMNFLPSVVASRLTPLLEVEFAFNRSVPEPKVAQPHMWSPGLMKFLLGGDQSAVADPNSPSATMLGLRETHDKDNKQLHSIAGMEMFTSPQTLVNVSPAANAGRYVDVLDPFRPLMSIESFSVNVAPTVGLYSYKKATLVFKLHDRTRLSEIADLVRPQVYQDSSSAPTIWITYGWRHPSEPGNPYADFINGNMLVREAYGIINTQFSFDQVGQVTLTMSLWTKGLPEMRTMNVNDDGSLQVVKEIRDIAQQVARYRNALGIGPVEGVNKEVRGFLLLEAAERGSFPDMSTDDIKKALDSLKSSLRAPNAKLDKQAADGLLKELNKLYNPSDKSYLDYKKRLESQATNVTNARFAEVMNGPDPFLPSAAKNAKKQAESKSEPHPLTTLVETLNAYASDNDVKTMVNPTNKSTSAFRKKAVSFGKLVSVFTANTFKQIDEIDELQLFFYQFNDQAGACASVNIAEFPIEMPVFLDQYRDHVERKGSERVTLEEFLRLVIDAQLHDTRAIGYGFRQYFAPYDPANKQDAKLKKGINPEQLELARAQFRMPTIEVYVETVYSSTATNDVDKLHQFEASPSVSGFANGGRARQYVRIMRVHIFDKSNNPYKLADAVLQSDDKLSFVEVDNAYLRQQVQDKKKTASDVWASLLKTLTPDAKIDRTKNGNVSNQQIKDFVSKMVPTIVYGGNASSIINANLASKQDPLLATTQMQAQAKGAGQPQALQSNGSDVGGLPLRIVPASMSLTTFGCPLLMFGQMFFIDFNTGTTVDNIYGLTGITHTLTPGKFESNMTLTFADAYGKFFGAPTIIDYVKSMQVP